MTTERWPMMLQSDYEQVHRIIRNSNAGDLEEIEGLIKNQWARLELQERQTAINEKRKEDSE